MIICALVFATERNTEYMAAQLFPSLAHYTIAWRPDLRTRQLFFYGIISVNHPRKKNIVQIVWYDMICINNNRIITCAPELRAQRFMQNRAATGLRALTIKAISGTAGYDRLSACAVRRVAE